MDADYQQKLTKSLEREKSECEKIKEVILQKDEEIRRLKERVEDGERTINFLNESYGMKEPKNEMTAYDEISMIQ